MKKTHITALFLLSAMMVSCVSCSSEVPSGNDASSGNTSNDTTSNTDAAVDTSLRENTPDNLPNLDFKGDSVTIVYRSSTADDVTGGEEETGDLVNDAVFKRNRSVEERLNIKFNYVAGTDGVTDFSALVRSSVLAGSDDYDIVYHRQYQNAILGVEGLFVNLIDASYINFDQPWWKTDYMDTIAINPDTAYMLVGDFSIAPITYCSTTFVNTSMIQNVFGSVEDFYQMVLDGGWTIDVMRKYCSDVYQDLNSDGKAGYEDILGLASSWASQVEHFAFSAGAKYTTRGSDGYPMLIEDQSMNVNITEKLYALFFETEGFLYDSDYTSQGNAQLKSFKDGNMLFYVGTLGTVSSLRDMKDSYGIIPRPKLDEAQKEYKSLVHDSVTTCAIPITNHNPDMACAALEALAAEGYRKVIPAYYEVALKVKYAQDDVSVQLIDLIYESATTDFIYANNYVFEGAGTLGTISRTLIKANSKDYMSAYASIQPKLQAAFDNLFTEMKNVD